jgi:hypothetical protein
MQFGAIDIDSELVAFKEALEGEQQIMMLNNGCLCCTVKDDLLDMLEQLVRGGYVAEVWLISSLLCHACMHACRSSLLVQPACCASPGHHPGPDNA